MHVPPKIPAAIADTMHYDSHDKVRAVVRSAFGIGANDDFVVPLGVRQHKIVDGRNDLMRGQFQSKRTVKKIRIHIDDSSYVTVFSGALSK